ncbi:MAG: cytochrome c3 family protein [Deltaproteobacteria bacterium]|nr:cytochrome c3 family protein [Deltaproteobacteria bacterium]
MLLAGAAGSRPGEYSEEGAVACIDCHETPAVMGILETAHAKASDPKTPAAQKQCQSCHGPSAVHMQFPMQVANVHFGSKSGAKPQVQNRMCLECHGTEAGREGWSGSAHGFEDIVCSSCHSLHDPAKVVPTRAAVSASCTDSCHEKLMGSAKAADFSHATGQDLGDRGELTCTGCHDPHGPLTSERCSECHTRTAEAFAKESPKARRYHDVAEAKGTECIRCHKGIAHPIRPLVLEESTRAMEGLLRE